MAGRLTPGLLSRQQWQRLGELALMVAVVAGLIVSLRDYHINHRPPQPFWFSPVDTLTDWFQTVGYVDQSGTFDTELFNSIYPPVAFLVLRLMSTPAFNMYDLYYARDCDHYSVACILVCYLACFLIAWWAFYRNDRTTGHFRGIAFGLGFPLLFALERGNTITIAFVFFVLAYGNIVRSRAAQVINLAIAVNLKPYLLAPIFCDVVKRNWRFFEHVVIAILIVFAVTYTILGDGDPLKLYRNITFFAGSGVKNVFERIYYVTSFESFLELDSYRFPARSFIPSPIVDALVMLIRVTIVSTTALIGVTLAAAWLRPDAISRLRTMLLLFSIHLVTAAEAGYLYMFVIFAVFMERGRSLAVTIAVVAAYLELIPYDAVLGSVFKLGGYNWLSGYDAELDIGPSIGMVLRPLAYAVIVWVLSLDTLVTVTRRWRDGPPVLGLTRPRWMTA